MQESRFDCFFDYVYFEYLSAKFSGIDAMSELSGVWGKELFESDEKKKMDRRSERTPRVFPMLRKGAVFLPPMLLVLFAQKVHNLVPVKK